MLLLPALVVPALVVPVIAAQGAPDALDDHPHLRNMAPPRIETPRMPRWIDVAHPAFEKYPVEAGELLDGAILEQFDDLAAFHQHWTVPSGANRDGLPFSGNWTLAAPELLTSFKNDLALLLVARQEPSALVRALDTPLDNTDKTLVVQYEIKLQKPLNCGGMYIKLLPESPSYDNFSDTFPYRIMFGPDVCGSVTNKVHFIIHYNGEEHQLIEAPFPAEPDFKTNLYTLIIHPDQRFEIRVNGVVRRAGSLLDDALFEPPLRGALDVFDPTDEVPANWDSRLFVPDPKEPKKPADYPNTNESLLFDTTARKPKKWNESEPLFVPDPDQTAPATWNEAEDGPWPGMVKINPKCEHLNPAKGEGCGPWHPPLVRNKYYQREWTQPLMPNPNYMGEYKRRSVPNPDRLSESARPSDLEGTIGAVGFELFTSSALILFDNLYVGHSVVDAENIGNATWSPKYYLETVLQQNIQKAFKEQEDVYVNNNSSWLEIYQYEVRQLWLDPRGYVAEIYRDFMAKFAKSGWEAVTGYPVSVVVFTVLLFTCTMLGVQLGSPRVRGANKYPERVPGERAPCRELDAQHVREHTGSDKKAAAATDVEPDAAPDAESSSARARSAARRRV